MMRANEPSKKEVAIAIRADDAKTLRELCADKRLNTFLDEEREGHWLSYAIQQDASVQVLQVLIDAGVDPHELTKKSFATPLGRSIRKQRLDCLEFLLTLGVSPSNENATHRLSLSAVNDEIAPELQIKMLSLLLKHGTDFNHAFPWFGDENFKRTVLDQASHAEVVDYLRSIGAKTAEELAGTATQTRPHRKVERN